MSVMYCAVSSVIITIITITPQSHQNVGKTMVLTDYRSTGSNAQLSCFPMSSFAL